MRATLPFLLAAAAAAAGCVVGAEATETHGSTRSLYAGAVLVKLTNASPQRMCGLYMIDDAGPDYGDNWLSDSGLPSGSSADFRVKPGKYKIRWNTCRQGNKPYYAATLWRESAVTVQRQTQLYAFVSDNVPPTKRAQPMGRDYDVVRFPGQMIDPRRSPMEPPPPPPEPPAPERLTFRGFYQAPPITGFVGRVLLSPDQAARVPRPPPAAPPPAPKPASR